MRLKSWAICKTSILEWQNWPKTPILPSCQNVPNGYFGSYLLLCLAFGRSQFSVVSFSHNRKSERIERKFKTQNPNLETAVCTLRLVKLFRALVERGNACTQYKMAVFSFWLFRFPAYSIISHLIWWQISKRWDGTFDSNSAGKKSLLYEIVLHIQYFKTLNLSCARNSIYSNYEAFEYWSQILWLPVN